MSERAKQYLRRQEQRYLARGILSLVLSYVSGLQNSPSPHIYIKSALHTEVSSEDLTVVLLAVCCKVLSFTCGKVPRKQDCTPVWPADL